MIKLFRNDMGCHFTMKTVLTAVVVVLGLSAFTPALGANHLRITGDPVSSGKFHDVVVHFYTEVLPPLVEARDVEKLRAAIPLDGVRWKLKDKGGKTWDHSGRRNHLRGLFSRSLGKGEVWDISVKIEKVTMTDAAHGAVLWMLVNNWKKADRAGKGQSSRRYLTHWEKIDGQWRIVATEHGRTEL